jgi:ABC-type amino acid transport substrate-binding protein
VSRGITITKDREEVVDFSYPMFSAGLRVMTSSRAGSRGWSDELADLLTAGIGPYVLVLIAALITAGHVVWLATRRRTGRGYVRGVAMGVYQAAGPGLVGDYALSSIQNKITGVNDLAGVRVLTVAGTSSEDYLRAHSIAYSSVPRIEDAQRHTQQRRGAGGSGVRPRELRHRVAEQLTAA